MMMPWLLKNEGYPPAVVIAVLLHAILLYVIFEREMSPAEFVQIQAPTIVATTIQENPQRLRRLENEQAQRQKQQEAERQRQREQRAEQERQRVAAAEAERVKQEAERKVAAERQREQTAQRQREEEQQRKREADELAERQRQDQARRDEAAKQEALKAEAERRAADARAQEQALTEEQQLVAQYMSIIRDQVADNWDILPNFRNGMAAMVALRITPTGEIISKNIVQSSGDILFDRSVLQAVEKIERDGGFPELKELPNAVFERNFRSFTLLFQPEDLLR